MESTLMLSPRTAEIAAQFDRWNEALESGDPRRVAALYAPDAVLVPTMSNMIRRNAPAIIEYFMAFKKRAPRGRIHDSHIRDMGDYAIHSGVYVFTLTNEAGVADVPARFTFVYERHQGDWRIIEHHSSYMPDRGAF